MNKLMTFGLSLCASSLLAATDGTIMRAGGTAKWNPGSGNYSAIPLTDNWTDGVYAKEGGRVTFSAATDVSLQQNVSGLKVSGFDFTTPHMLSLTPGSPVTLTGEKPTMTMFGGSTLLTQVNVLSEENGDLTVKATGANGQYANLDLQTIWYNGFGSVTLSSIWANLRGTQHKIPSNVKLKSSSLVYAPATSGTPSADINSNSGARLTIGGGVSSLQVAKSSATSCTLTVGPIDREDHGVLDIRSGDATLGTDVFVKTTGEAPVHNGLLDPWIVDFKTFGFLSYDAEKGFVPATALSSTTPAADKIFEAGAEQAISADTTVLGLRQAYPATSLTFANNATLTVGDGVNPAALMIATRNGQYTIGGTGAIDFGGSEGLLWFWNKDYNGRNITISAPIKGEQDVTFASAAQDQRPSIITIGGNAAQWKGDLHIVNVRLYLASATSRPAGAIYVQGGNQKNSGQLAIGFDGLANHIYIAGNGICNTDSSGAIIAYGTGVRTVNGEVTLLGDATLIGGVAYHNTINGTGDLTIYNSASEAREIAFHAANAYVGETRLVNQKLRLGANGTFGTGRVTVGAAATLTFDGGTKTLANDIEATGPVTVKGAALDLSDKVVMKTLTLDEKSTLTVKDLTVSLLTGGAIQAADVDSRLVIDCATDTGLATKLTAATGKKLTLVKTGPGKLTISPEFLSGNVVVEIVEGTVATAGAKLTEPIATGRLYWLDATKADSMTVTDGKVVEWRDASANGFTFTQYIDSNREYGYPTLVENSVNGHATVNFAGAAGDVGNRLCGSGVCEQRTVFLVTRAKSGMISCAAPFGEAFSDRNGIRLYDETRWFVAFNYAHFFDQNGFFINGANASANLNYPSIGIGQVQVLSALKTTRDLSSRNAVFVPAIGGYCNNGAIGLERNFNGEIAEVIAYDRVLTAGERMLIENYLAEKWTGSTFHSSIPATFPAEGGLTLGPGTTLDLAGLAATVGTLNGQGGIVSSGDGTVTLTVTESATAELTAGENVTVSVGGTGSFAVDKGLPPTDGLLWWLDANASETIVTNAAGNVTGWSSRGGCTETFAMETGLFAPWYALIGSDKASDDGKPGVWFDNTQGRTRLVSASTDLKAKTIFLVARPASEVCSFGGFIGRKNYDCGVRTWQALDGRLQVVGNGNGSNMMSLYEDEVRVDGVVNKSWDNSGVMNSALFASGKTHQLTLRVSSGRTPIAWQYALGSYHGSQARSFNGWLCETIAYDRALSDVEVARVEAYLARKWQSAGPVPAETTAVGGAVRVEKGATLTVATGTQATLAASAGTVNGDVTLANPYVVTVGADGGVEQVTVNGTATIAPETELQIVNATRLPRGAWATYLSATAVNGAVDSVKPDDPVTGKAKSYLHKETATAASVGYFTGFLMIFR